MKKKVWSLLLAVMMALTMFPVGAWAEEEVVEVENAADLIKAFQMGGEIRLAQDITISDFNDSVGNLSNESDHSVVLDLNQHTLTLSDSVKFENNISIN